MATTLCTPCCGTCQPQTISAIKGLPLSSYSCWEESVEEGWWRTEEGSHSQHCVHLKGLVFILGKRGDFEEIRVCGMTDGEGLIQSHGVRFTEIKRQNVTEVLHLCYNQHTHTIGSVTAWEEISSSYKFHSTGIFLKCYILVIHKWNCCWSWKK